MRRVVDVRGGVSGIHSFRLDSVRCWQRGDRQAGEDEHILAGRERRASPESGDRIDGLHMERVLDTYRVYKMGYREELNRVKEELGRFANLRLLGRTGTFWYNNMDHSIKMAIDQVGEIEREGRSE